MALRTTPLRPLQDENAQHVFPSGKTPHNDRKGLQGVVERKKLSNITNHVLTQPKLVGKTTTEKDSLSVRPDSQHSKKNTRPPLKNISNSAVKPVAEFISKIPSKLKAEEKVQSNTSFQFPPRSKLNLTEEMRKKAALWAEEGIESVHFTGEDMEKLQKKTRDEEIAKRVAMIRNCKMDIPFPKLSTPRSFTWFPSDVLEPDPLKDLDDSDYPDFKDPDMHIDEELLSCLDYISICSPPRFTEGWPQMKDDDI